MDATSRARFRVLSILVTALVGVAGCASADSGDESAMPSEVSTSSENVTQSPSETAAPTLQTGELKDALFDVMSRYDIPGVSLAITTPEGTWSMEHGAADYRNELPVEANMAWPLRSVTKSVVVTVLLQLVDEGQLSLDDTIDTYIQGVPHGDEITLRQLANTSSGVGDYTHSQAFIDRLNADSTQQFTLEELNEYGLAEGQQFAPGTDHVYSNTSTNLLGVVIEEVTGQSIGEAIEERIIERLRLTDTVYAESHEDWADPHPHGYQPDDIQGQGIPIFNNFSSMGASGVMISTTVDMSEWASALGEGELISDELHAERLESAQLSEGPEYDDYGLGIGSLEGWWGHTGEGLGFSSLVMHEPESNTSVVIFMNMSDAFDTSDEGSGARAHAPTVLMREFAGILSGEGRSSTDPETPTPEEDPLPLETLEFTE